jgi:inosine-uridine nucleoside N-ribohydrolase
MEDIKKLEEIGKVDNKSAKSKLQRVGVFLQNLLRVNDAACTYDPVAAAFLINPKLTHFERIRVGVFVNGPLEGKLFIDEGKEEQQEEKEATSDKGTHRAHVWVGTKLEQKSYFEFLHNLMLTALSHNGQ